MADVDHIDDSSSLPIADVSSLFKDTLVSGLSNRHVANEDALASGSSSPHVVDAPDSSTLLFGDDGNT
jgi:hypothetical protein